MFLLSESSQPGGADPQLKAQQGAHGGTSHKSDRAAVNRILCDGI